MKYRIKSRQVYTLWVLKDINTPDYRVQAKYPWLPFWINVTRPFKLLQDAEQYIELITKETSK